MGQSRLFGLAILSIENARARQLDLQDLIEDFAQRKASYDVSDNFIYLKDLVLIVGFIGCLF